MRIEKYAITRTPCLIHPLSSVRQGIFQHNRQPTIRKKYQRPLEWMMTYVRSRKAPKSFSPFEKASMSAFSA